MALDPGIYSITSLTDGRRYIGSGQNIRKRFWEHKKSLTNGNHHSSKLQQAWHQYGPEYFSFDRLLVCAPEMLLFFEQLAIDAYEAVSNGFNMCPVAGNCRGIKRPPEVCAKLGRPRGYKASPEARARMSEAQRGKPRPWFKGNKNRLGIKTTEETKLKISAALIGKPSPHKGARRTAEFKAKISASKLGNKYGAANKGRPRSKETKRKVSDGLKKYYAGLSLPKPTN